MRHFATDCDSREHLRKSGGQRAGKPRCLLLVCRGSDPVPHFQSTGTGPGPAGCNRYRTLAVERRPTREYSIDSVPEDDLLDSFWTRYSLQSARHRSESCPTYQNWACERTRSAGSSPSPGTAGAGCSFPSLKGFAPHSGERAPLLRPQGTFALWSQGRCDGSEWQQHWRATMFFHE